MGVVVDLSGNAVDGANGDPFPITGIYRITPRVGQYDETVQGSGD